MYTKADPGKRGVNRASGRGVTLIELLIFIVILGVAATSILSVFGSLTRNSASLLPDKQAQAIAAGLLEEILAQPYTFCDPDAPNARTATVATVAACGGPVENLGPEAGETRNGVPAFDNVNDYHSSAPLPVATLNQPPGTGTTPLAGGYTYQVTVASAGAMPGVLATETLRVTVVVTPPGGTPARLDGVRIRYAPRT
jgi:MSHA pilin protein MshD